jgi:hypothetical protein
VAAVRTSHDGFIWADISHDVDRSGSPFMIQVIEGGAGVVILGDNVTVSHSEPWAPTESVIWVGSPSKPNG